jgi:tetratricopeptide (TPR) repeat protein
MAKALVDSAANPIPDPEDVASQLRRMLASKRFLNAPNQADFLKLVVRRALKGQKSPGHVIAKALFSDKFDRKISTDVRVTAGNLRTTLKRYYAEEGRDDPIIIALPEPPPDRSVKLAEGEAYTPLFSVNPASEGGTLYREGLHQISSCEPERIHDGLSRLQSIIEDQPKHAAAHAALAEGFLRLLLFESVIHRRAPALYLPLAEHSADAAIALDPRLCMARVARAVTYACRCRWAEAETTFKTALKLDGDALHGAMWYPAFLLATARANEALAIVEAHAKAEPDHVGAHLAYVLFLYATRQFYVARKRLLRLRDMAVSNWIFHALSGLNNLALGSPQWALADFVSAANVIHSGRSSANSSADLLVASQSGKSAENRAKQAYFPGFLVLCLAKWQELDPVPEQAAEKLQWLISKPTGSLQLALAQTGLGKFAEAVASLEQAVRDGNPLMAWLPFWPVFDSLRDDQGFKRVIGELHLPADRSR